MSTNVQNLVKFALAAVISVGLMGLFPLSSLADPPDRPTPGLPERPATRDSSSPEDDEDNGNENEQGAIGYIDLQVIPTTTDLWAEVQWEDLAGNWHTVEGWRGTVVNGSTRWWVEEKDFGKGPFRWVIYQQQGGPLLAVSQLFYLPDQSQQSLVVFVWLDSAP